MANSHYEPPKQSVAGQLFDSIFLLILVFVALFAPLEMGLAGGGKTELAVADKTTWVGLEKLGMTPETAAGIITSRFDYSFDVTALIITLVVVVGYFLLLFRFSKIEYRDVIEERFGKK